MEFSHPFAPLSTYCSQGHAALSRAGLRQGLARCPSWLAAPRRWLPLTAPRRSLGGGSREPGRSQRGLRLRALLAHVPTLPAWFLASDLRLWTSLSLRRGCRRTSQSCCEDCPRSRAALPRARCFVTGDSSQAAAGVRGPAIPGYETGPMPSGAISSSGTPKAPLGSRGICKPCRAMRCGERPTRRPARRSWDSAEGVSGELRQTPRRNAP